MLIYGKNAILSYLQKKPNYIEKIFLIRGKKQKFLANIISLCNSSRIDYEFIDNSSKILKKHKNVTHQGIFAQIKDFNYQDINSVINKILIKKKNPFFLLLDQIQDGRNLGAIIRTSCCCDELDAIILCGNSSCKITPEVIKTSTGGVLDVPIIYHCNTINAIKILKKFNIWIYGLDMNGNFSYENVDYNIPVCCVLGSEGKGIRNIVRNNLDMKINIPMNKKSVVDSLNISVVAALIIYQVRNYRKYSV